MKAGGTSFTLSWMLLPVSSTEGCLHLALRSPLRHKTCQASGRVTCCRQTQLIFAMDAFFFLVAFFLSSPQMLKRYLRPRRPATADRQLHSDALSRKEHTFRHPQQAQLLRKTAAPGFDNTKLPCHAGSIKNSAAWIGASRGGFNFRIAQPPGTNLRV